jgi:hypothetical protein
LREWGVGPQPSGHEPEAPLSFPSSNIRHYLILGAQDFPRSNARLYKRSPLSALSLWHQLHFSSLTIWLSNPNEFVASDGIASANMIRIKARK